MNESTYKIGKISKIYVGGDRPAICSDNLTEECTIPVYSNGIGNEGLYGYTNISKVKGDSITISARGVNIGTSFYRENEYYPIIRLLCIEPNKDIVYPKYLFYYLQQYEINGSGSAQPQITKPFFSNMKINIIDDITLQKKIGDTIFNFDKMIKINNKKIECLENSINEIYKEWFVRFRFPGYEETEFLDGIPKKWNIEPLGDSSLTKIKSSGIKQFEGEKIYLPTANVDGIHIVNRKDIITYEDRPSRANMQPKKNTVWFAKMQNSRKLLICDDYNEELLNNIILSTGFTGLNVKEGSIYYVFSYLMSESFDCIKNMYANGSTQQAVNNDKINKIKFLVPDMSIINKYDSICKPLFKNIYFIEQENLKLEKMKNDLLKKMLLGNFLN